MEARAVSLTPLHSFTELEQRISALGDENSKTVGDAFEVFVEGYLAAQQKMQADAVWLVGDIPLEIRQQLNLPNDTKGIDGVFRTRTGTLVPYQVKFRSRPYLTYIRGRALPELSPNYGGYVLVDASDPKVIVAFVSKSQLAVKLQNCCELKLPTSEWLSRRARFLRRQRPRPSG